MDFATIKARTSFLAAQAGWSDAEPPTGYADMDEFLGALVNESLQEIAFESEYNVETDTFATVIGQAEYNLATATDGERAFIRVEEAVYGTDTPLTPVTEEEVRRSNRTWLMQANALPQYFWTSTSGTLRLYSPPSAVATVTIRGPREPEALVDDTDTPTMPQAFHLAIALRAVLLLSEAYIDDAMDIARLARYETSCAQRVSKLKRHAGDDDAEVQRYVAPRLTRRVMTGMGRGY